MVKTEGEVAGLEALAVAAPQDLEIHLVGHHGAHACRQCFMRIAVAVIQQLNGEAVERPVHARRTGGDAHRQRAFIADRQLHQHMRQVCFIHFSKLELGAFAEDAHPGQRRELDRKGADANQDDAEGELKELRKTVHGDRSGPHKAVFSNRRTGRSGPIWTFARQLGTGWGELLLPGGL